MAKEGYMTGDDAAYIKPKFIPNTSLMARDDSGGPEWDPYTQEFGDGQLKIGSKPWLSAKGGEAEPIEGSEVSDKYRTAGYDKIGDKHRGQIADAKAKKESQE